jgi:hypothetical protein
MPFIGDWEFRIVSRNYHKIPEMKLFKAAVVDDHDIHGEIKGRLNSGNACYYSVQNLLPSRFILKKPKD